MEKNSNIVLSDFEYIPKIQKICKNCKYIKFFGYSTYICQILSSDYVLSEDSKNKVIEDKIILDNNFAISEKEIDKFCCAYWEDL